MSKTFSHAKDRDTMEAREYERAQARSGKESVRTLATRRDEDAERMNAKRKGYDS